ncbi:MAG: hypothetical protein RML56_01085 [Burkholderiales bacterium]|nr:hypothetical protein [Burkholderiales bacterium]
MQEGDIILSVNGVPVKDVAQVSAASSPENRTWRCAPRAAATRSSSSPWNWAERGGRAMLETSCSQFGKRDRARSRARLGEPDRGLARSCSRARRTRSRALRARTKNGGERRRGGCAALEPARGRRDGMPAATSSCGWKSPVVEKADCEVVVEGNVLLRARRKAHGPRLGRGRLGACAGVRLRGVRAREDQPFPARCTPSAPRRASETAC